MMTPFALEVYRRYLNGETMEELSTKLEIPLDRIETRIRAAEAYLARRHQIAA